MALGYVRPARPAEAEQLARIQVTTWRTAYRRLFPASVLSQLDEAWLAQRWRTAIQTPPSPAHQVLVAYEQTGDPAGAPAGGELVGFAAVGPADEQAAAPDQPAPPAGTGAITELLVEPRWGRRGHGSRLLAASVAAWREAHLTTAVAWAYEADVATRTFLTSAGWQPDGATRALDVDDLLVPQLRLHVTVEEAGSPA